MRFTRGIFFGFVIGTVIGVLIYLKSQRENGGPGREKGPLRIHLPDRREQTDPIPAPRAEPQPEPSDVPLEAVSGIGKVRADRLRKGGINTLSDLASAAPERIQEILGARVSLDAAAGFITQAMSLL